MNIGLSAFAVLADIIGLSVFGGLRESLLLGSFKNLIESVSEEKTQDAAFLAQSNSTLDMVEKWAAFLEAFMTEQKGYSFYLSLIYLTTVDENAFTLGAEDSRTPLPPVLQAAAKTDLARLGRIASFDIPGLGFFIAEICRKSGLTQLAGNIEEESRVLWAAEGKKMAAESAAELLALFPEDSNWGTALPAFIEFIRKRGAGLMGLFNSFRWEWVDASLSMPPLNPVKNPDPVRLDDLTGYEEQRAVVIANTLRLLDGRPANNLLLYGDRGTGKSATVKAVCNEYAPRGLRLLEVHKGDLMQLSPILDFLGSRGLCFVVFIDDLSFESLDDSLTGLKTILEGGLETRPSNVVIYAASKGRQQTREHPGRPPDLSEDDETPEFDTPPEFSLADRFGVTVTFNTPGQEGYIKIAEHIAHRRGLLSASSAEYPKKLENFRANALRWEQWFNGPSPRTAVQFVDWLTGGEDFPWN